MDAEKPKVYPGQILGFAHFDTAATAAAFNSGCLEEDQVDSLGGCGYAITESSSNHLEGFLDPATMPIDEQRMQANTSLLFWEKKVTLKKRSPTTRKPPEYGVRQLNISSIFGPVAAFRYFDPAFKHKNKTMTCGK